MFISDLIIALLIAIAVTFVFAVVFRRVGPWFSVIVFFFVIFFAAWAGGIWLPPAGPSLWGIYWVPFLVVALIFAFLLAATAPALPKREGRESPTPDTEKEKQAAAVFGIFFWILMVALGVTIIARYITRFL
ncbi:MAG: hypothetical protein AB1805_11045 [Nitrospirota bacterium]